MVYENIFLCYSHVPHKWRGVAIFVELSFGRSSLVKVRIFLYFLTMVVSEEENYDINRLNYIVFSV